ncbi:hypothetical protein ACFYL6_20225 [Micromonospora sp. NPDC007208]|uniref:hypothetical protein n=1 Tax=Micromonospora sp. NPDC007208 TaxID=3364236 RepID=UPI0036AFBB5C
MADGTGLDCLEFVTTWVRSGQYLSMDKTPLSPEVHLAEPVAGLQLIHSAAGATVSESITTALLAQPLGMLARAVDAPPSSVAASLDLDAAITRADALRLPVRVPGNALAGSTSDRVLPIDAHGRPADLATTDYVLVLPATHLVSEHFVAENLVAGLDRDLGRIVQGPPMPGQLRWTRDRAELGLPLPIVNARFAGADLANLSTDATRTIEGGIIGLWRELAYLEPGQAMWVRVTEAGMDTPEDVLAIQSPDGIALLRDTPAGAQAATLPRNPATIEVSPAVVSAELNATAGLLEPFAAAVPAVHTDPQAAAVRLGGRGGLMLLDRDQTAQINAARNFRAAVDEYPVFAHSTPAGPIVGGRLITAKQLSDLIAADPLSRGKVIILVQCDAASSTTIVDDFAAALFAALPPQYTRVVAMGGTAWVQPGPAESDELTEVLVTRTVLTADGQVRLVAGGTRVYTEAENVVTPATVRTPVVHQYGPALSQTRAGNSVRLTDTYGDVLTGDEAPTTDTVRELTGIGIPTDAATIGVPFNYTFAQAYQGVATARAAAATAALNIAMWADQANDARLATAARLFNTINGLQHTAPTTLSPEIFQSLKSNDMENVRADILRRAGLARDNANTRAEELTTAINTARSVAAYIFRDPRQVSHLPGLRPHVHANYQQTFDQVTQYYQLSAKGAYRNPYEQGMLNNLTVQLRGPAGAQTTLTAILNDLNVRLGTDSLRLKTSADNLSNLMATVEAGRAWENVWLNVSHTVAESVISRVREKLSYGPANNEAVMALYNHGANALLHHVRAPVYRKNPQEQDLLREFSAWSYMASYFRTGNCDEHAAVALAELFLRPDMIGVPITYVHGNVFDRNQLRPHTFLVIGPLGHPNTLVVDAWPLFPTAVRAGRYIADMNVVTRAWNVVPDGHTNMYTLGRDQIHTHLLPQLQHPVLRAVPIPVFTANPTSFDTLHTDRYATAAYFPRRFAASVAPGAVHESPQDAAVYLPDDRPGLYLLGRDQQHLIDAAREFRAGDNEYPVFIEGTVDGPVVDGRLITPEQLRELIVRDPNSAGRDILAVVCDLAITRAGTTPLDDFATRLFTLLPAENKRVLAAGGVAQVVLGTTDRPTEVVVSPTVLGDDGRFRLLVSDDSLSGGFREILDAPDAEQVPGHRTPMVVQHGPRLSLARAGTGVALTDRAGGLLTGADAPAVSSLTALGLPDPARVQRLYDSGGQREATVTEQPVVPAEAVGPPSWPLRLNPGVTAHRDVHVISSNSRNAPQGLIDELVEAADVDHPVILLGAPRPGRAALAEDIGALNYLLEQFAQQGRLPVVVTRSAVDSELRKVLTRYGVALLHPTLERANGSGLGSLQVDHWWTVAVPRQGGNTETSTDVRETQSRANPPSIGAVEMITTGVLDAAARLARPTEAVARVDDALGELIWAADLAASRDVFRRLEEQWSAERMTAGLAQVKKMIERVPGQPELGIFAPVLELGAVGQADIAFDYAGADEATRPKVLLDSVGRLETAGQLDMPVDGGLSTGQLVSMVTAAGVTDISGSVLTVLGDIKAGRFENAENFIAKNRGTLSVEQKQQWVNAITDLHTSMPNHINELQLLREGVLNC